MPYISNFYGTFNGIAEEFKTDISEEYSLMKEQDWFNYFKDELFVIENKKPEEVFKNKYQKKKRHSVEELQELENDFLINIDQIK